MEETDFLNFSQCYLRNKHMAASRGFRRLSILIWVEMVFGKDKGARKRKGI